jgi:peptide subunit release factor 1 (eRF1)
MAAFSSARIEVLLDQPRAQGMVLSCYADTSVAAGFEQHWRQPFKAEASAIRQRLAEDQRARAEFERNLEAVRHALESPEARHARGMAVFSAAERGFFVALPASEPYENQLVIDEDPYVVPLLEAEFRQRGYLVVLADTHRARWYAAGRGGSRVLGAIDEAVPKKQRAAGERWGKQQATIERHWKDHILHFQKELTQRLDQAWGEYQYRGIILLGQHEVLEQLRNMLPAQLSSRVVHEAPQSWVDDHAPIDERVSAVLKTAQDDEERRVLADLDARLHEGKAVAAGPQEAINALTDGQVAAVILGPDPRANASRCTGCGALFAGSRSDCPCCSTHCRTVNLWQEILAFAVLHDVWVYRVRPSERLNQQGGVVALLARDEPQWAATPASEEARPGG